MNDHKVRIVRCVPSYGDDQRLVICTCGFQAWCLYAWEARMSKWGHLAEHKKTRLASTGRVASEEGSS
jgi:hypothetical protein